ncbi:MAG: hypothetical protein LBU65_06045 [Planctomycetaceae bacterium]|nr:hypothetical protein [Planctomycetaceae bacterium]
MNIRFCYSTQHCVEVARAYFSMSTSAKPDVRNLQVLFEEGRGGNVARYVASETRKGEIPKLSMPKPKQCCPLPNLLKGLMLTF